MDINIIGVPLFYGCDKPGVDLGPNTLRENGLVNIFSKNHNVNDLGNIFINNVNTNDKFIHSKKMKYLNEIVDANELLANSVWNSLKNDKFPLVIGGDHALALGSVAASGEFYKDDYAVIWVDAHGDLNTENTTPSGNVHGMPLAASMGLGDNDLTSIFSKSQKVSMKNVFILGARDLDQGELDLIKSNNLNVWTMKAIKEKGLDACINEVLDIINKKNINNIHLSFDIDSIDPSFVPGTGTPVDDGLTLEGGKKIISSLFMTKKVKSMDFVEFNPLLDSNDTCLNSCLSLLNTISNSL
ncbi:arginase [Clostridium sp. SHJSY1]|uniref:arginase n=1 Tax=Clostridium sp. SHJSY1 TaxID=2942483 RepID=UPI0028763F72|nr:arginase [Clostridium sp. SHJSY1]MDS0524746.1 arginase [Clostridium sp. SHJSY1]